MPIERRISVGAWIECDDGSLFRVSTLLPGMTIEKAERVFSQHGAQNLHSSLGA